MKSEPPAAQPALAKTEARPARRLGAIPGGQACLSELSERGIAFEPRREERGVTTPVLVKGPIGGVRYFSDGMPFIADCRMVVALTELSSTLADLGVTQARFSGAYVYRTKRSGRLSLHAHGLAIDIHEVWVGGERLRIKNDFARGLGKECKADMPVLNMLACRVREQQLFKELLTPDDNADHYDHLHFGLAPLPGEFPNDAPIVKPPVRKAPAAPLENKTPKASEEDELPPIENIVPEPAPAPEETTSAPTHPAEVPAPPTEAPAPPAEAPKVEVPGSLPEMLPDPASP